MMSLAGQRCKYNLKNKLEKACRIAMFFVTLCLKNNVGHEKERITKLAGLALLEQPSQCRELDEPTAR
jgi:hypothetical protein